MTDKKEIYKCDICNTTYTTKKGLNVHKGRDVHLVKLKKQQDLKENKEPIPVSRKGKSLSQTPDAIRKRLARDLLRKKIGDAEFKNKMKQEKRGQRNTTEVKEVKEGKKEFIKESKLEQLQERIASQLEQLLMGMMENKIPSKKVEKELLKMQEILPVIQQQRQEITDIKVINEEKKKLANTGIKKAIPIDDREAFYQSLPKINLKNGKPLKVYDKQSRDTKFIGENRGLRRAMANIEKIYKEMSGGDYMIWSDLDWMRDTNAVVDYVEEHYEGGDSVGTVLGNITAILGRTEGFDEEYKYYADLASGYKNGVKEQAKEGKFTEKKEYLENVDWDMILKQEKKPKGKITREYLLYSLYTKFPTRRIDDYTLMKVQEYTKNSDDLDKSFNYITQSNKNSLFDTFIFNNYKTNDIYGRQKFLLKGGSEGKLSDIITKYIDDNKLKSGRFLVVNQANDQKALANLTQILQKEFKRLVGYTLSVDDLRSLYVEHINNNRVSYADREKIASKMAHSVSESLQRYDKIREKTDEDEIIEVDESELRNDKKNTKKMVVKKKK